MSSYELVYQKLRENILNGHYKHGDELRETAVGKEIGVSRTPVREALRQLELEGLVTIIPNRGAFVNGTGCTGYLPDPCKAGGALCQDGGRADR